MTPLALYVVCGALATARLTRLVTADRITEAPRRWIGGFHSVPDYGDAEVTIANRHRLYLFITCPWCVSIWIAAAVVALSVLIPHVWIYAAAMLSASEVAGLLSRAE